MGYQVMWRAYYYLLTPTLATHANEPRVSYKNIQLTRISNCFWIFPISKPWRVPRQAGTPEKTGWFLILKKNPFKPKRFLSVSPSPMVGRKAREYHAGIETQKLDDFLFCAFQAGRKDRHRIENLDDWRVMRTAVTAIKCSHKKKR